MKIGYLLVFAWLVANVPALKNDLPDIMYVGMENQIGVTLNNCSPEDINVKVSVGNIYKRNDSTYAFTPQTDIEEFKIKLYYKKILCGVKTVEIKKMPEISLQFEGENKGFVTRKGIDNLGALKAKYPDDFDTTLQSTVYSFNIAIIEASGIAVFSANMRGDKLDEAAINAIKRQQGRVLIQISNVIATTPGRGHTKLQINKTISIVD